MTDSLVAGALLARLSRVADIVGRIDERDVRERLRKIAQLALSARVVFLGEQPNIVAQADEPVEHVLRLDQAASHHISVGKPETAGQKGAFAGRETVLGGGRVVTK